MRIEMAFAIHCHHDFAKQMIVTSFERERHVAFIEGKHSFGYQSTTLDRVDQYVFVSNLGCDSPCSKHITCELQQAPSNFVLVYKKFRMHQVPKTRWLVILYRDAKTTFALDQARKEPTFLLAN